MTEQFEYKVVELRQKLPGGKMSGARLEGVLNDHAAQGWRLNAITHADATSRLGPGGVNGMLVTFKRRTA